MLPENDPVTGDCIIRSRGCRAVPKKDWRAARSVVVDITDKRPKQEDKSPASKGISDAEKFEGVYFTVKGRTDHKTNKPMVFFGEGVWRASHSSSVRSDVKARLVSGDNDAAKKTTYYIDPEKIDEAWSWTKDVFYTPGQGWDRMPADSISQMMI